MPFSSVNHNTYIHNNQPDNLLSDIENYVENCVAYLYRTYRETSANTTLMYGIAATIAYMGYNQLKEYRATQKIIEHARPFRAVFNKKPEQLRQILANKNSDVNTLRGAGYGDTLLHAAAYVKDDNYTSEIFDILLNHPDIDINKRCVRGFTPLMMAAIYDNEIALNKLLTHNNIEVNRLRQQDNALSLAALENNLNAVRLLLNFNGSGTRFNLERAINNAEENQLLDVLIIIDQRKGEKVQKFVNSARRNQGNFPIKDINLEERKSYLRQNKPQLLSSLESKSSTQILKQLNTAYLTHQFGTDITGIIRSYLSA